MGKQVGTGANPIGDDTPSMEDQDDALRENAIDLEEQAIAFHLAELAKHRTELKAIKQRTGIYARS